MDIQLHANQADYVLQQFSIFCTEREKQKALCFREKLDVYSKNNYEFDRKSVGSYAISVENIGPDEREFLVHISSSLTIDSSMGWSRVISSVTGELHSLEEQRNEFFKSNDDNYENIFHLNSRESAYYIQVEKKSLCDNRKNSFYVLYNKKQNFMSIGSNILLTRYLALTNYNGSISFDFIKTDGAIVTCDYDCFPAKPMKLHGISSNIYIIHQKLGENGVIMHENRTLLTKHGKILCYDWIDTPYMMNSFLYPFNCSINPVIIPLKGMWKEDIQMMSKYLDKKAHENAIQEMYLSLHCEIRYLIADYVQAILCRKPEDIMKFTICYFKAFKLREKIESSPDDENYSSKTRDARQDSPNLENTSESSNSSNDSADTSPKEDLKLYILLDSEQSESSCYPSSYTESTRTFSPISDKKNSSYCSLDYQLQNMSENFTTDMDASNKQYCIANIECSERKKK